MILKYNQNFYPCHCERHNSDSHKFTTLCPIGDSPITTEDYKKYHNILDKIYLILKDYGFHFWNETVTLINHTDVTKESIIKLLKNLKEVGIQYD